MAQSQVHVFLIYHSWHYDLGHGWGASERTCAYCGRYYVNVAPIQTIIPPCPYCGEGDSTLLLSCDEHEPSDGPWLTGQYEIRSRVEKTDVA